MNTPPLFTFKTYLLQVKFKLDHNYYIGVSTQLYGCILKLGHDNQFGYFPGAGQVGEYTQVEGLYSQVWM